MRKLLIIPLLFFVLSGNAQIVVADHTVVDLYDDIPQQWIDSVKTQLVWISGMSHGYGYFRGAELLAEYDPTYALDFWYQPDPPPPDNDTALRLGRQYFGSIDSWFTNLTGNIKSLITEQLPSNPFDVVWLGWSYQATWSNSPGGTIDPVFDVHWGGESLGSVDGDLIWGLDAGDSVLTNNRIDMTDYIDSTFMFMQFCLDNSPETKIFFSNGVSDDNANTENAFQRELKNQFIRDYLDTVTSVEGYFIDYSDILVWSEDSLHTVDWNDGGDLRAHQQIHPTNQLDYDGDWNIVAPGVDAVEDHIGEVGAMELAKATWWLLARAAGWDGVAISVGDYYVATTGNDSYPGTSIDSAWATPQHAFETATSAGDTVYFMGGVYYPTGHASSDNIYSLSASGSYGNPISYFAYPGDTVIFDCSLVAPVIDGGNDYHTGLYIESAQHLFFKGITIRNVRQDASTVAVQGLVANLCTNLRFEEVNVHNIAGRGIYYNPYYQPDSTYFINCDVYNCFDSLQFGSEPAGGWGDGWNAISLDSSYFYMEGCRTWSCSDDGFNMTSLGLMVMTNNWALANGSVDGDGCGFKLQDIQDSLETDITERIYNNIAAYNNTGTTGAGFTENNNGQEEMEKRMWNNFSYLNKYGFVTFGWNIGRDRNNEYINNLAYANTVLDADDNFDNGGGSFETDITNSWTDGMDLTITNADFISLDTTGMRGARQSDGSLPLTNFGKLAEGSDMINVGTDVGLPYNGTAPDIGWSESNFSTGRTSQPLTGTGNKVMISGGVILHNNE